MFEIWIEQTLVETKCWHNRNKNEKITQSKETCKYSVFK